MEPVKPQQEHEWLGQLIGDWESEMECVMGPDQPPMKSKGTESVRSLGGLGAFWGQTTADRQLAAHRADPARRGHVLDTGLWRLSRHPNYFFEWLHWLAYPLLGLAAGLWGLWLWPLLMYVFLRYLTGVPFAEQQALRRRGAAYAAYQARTPVFFPRWP